MDFHDKFVNRFQSLSKESCCQQGKREYNAITLIMLYLKVLDDIVSQNP